MHSRHNGHVYRAPFITIWHVDPERRGNDNSCGFGYVCMSPEQREEVRKLGASEQVFINGEHGYAMNPFELVLEVWQTIAARMFKRERWKGRGLTHRELLYVINLANNPGDNLRHSCKGATTPEGMASLFATVLRCYLTYHRKWWQHPRWHIHHWKIQVHPLQAFKRWAFSRCAGCGKRFQWGYCPVSGQWSGGGPRWFRSEQHTYHSECYGQKCGGSA